MRRLNRTLLSVGLFLVTSAAALAAPLEEMALAERIASLADRFGSSAAAYRQALYEASSRLAESETRFKRQRYRAAEASGDSEAMLQTLQDWRKVEPTNLFVQMRLIDVYLSRLPTADARLNYVKNIVDSEKVDAQIRSHAAVHVARLQFEQSRTQQAMESLRRALVLNGLNLQALELQWEAAVEGSTPLQRMSMLLAMLRANPGSVEAAILVAQELSDAGMVKEALQWYAHASNMSQPFGGLVGAPAKNYAAELLIAGQDRGAAEITSRLLSADHSDPGAWLLTLMAERNIKDRIDLVKQNAQIGLLNRLAMARGQIGVAGATTRPLGSDDRSVPDLEGDGELLAKATPQQRAAYVEALSDLIWMVVYHQVSDVDAARLVAALEKAAPKDSMLLGRHKGWMQLRAGKIEEARAELAGVAQQDPLAGVAMVHVLRKDPASVTEATDLAKALLRRFPSRLIGVYVQAELAGSVEEGEPNPTADVLTDLLDRFPLELLELASAPQKFLAMRLQPRQVGHDFAEPVLVDVELRNTRDVPVVLGPMGMVRDLWIDVQTRGVTSQWVSGVSFEKTDGPVLLQPGASTRWTIRVDRGPLLQVLDRSVKESLQLSIFALTNAVPTKEGVVAGPAGIKGRMVQTLERRPASLVGDEAIRRAREIQQGDDAVLKLRLIDALAANMELMRAPEAANELKLMEPELRDVLSRLAADASPVVSCWARFRMSDVGVRPADELAADLAASPTWYGRLLAAATAMNTPAAGRPAVLQPLEKDPDQTVRRLAAAMPAAAESKRIDGK